MHSITRRVAAIVLQLSLAGAAFATPELAQELIAMEAVDQEIRNRSMKAPLDQTLYQEMGRVDAAHEARLTEIVRTGWPTAEMVGKPALRALWTLTQHASPAFLKSALPAMQKAADRGDLAWSTVALMIDRDLMYDGKKQIYGSQFALKGGTAEMHPVEDPDNLDARRKKVGLGPIAEYRARIMQMHRSAPAPK